MLHNIHIVFVNIRDLYDFIEVMIYIFVKHVLQDNTFTKYFNLYITQNICELQTPMK